MVRIEMIFLVGFLVGIATGVVGSHWARRWLTARDRRLTKVRVRESLHEVDTPELIDELSKREDLGKRER